MIKDNINFYLTSLNDDLNNLVHDDLQSYIGDYKKINIFNQNITSQIQKIWLLTPKLKMLGKIFVPSKNKQVALLSLILYDLNPEILKFKQFINSVEEKISDVIKKMGCDNIVLKSCVKTSTNFFPSLTISLPFTKNNDDIIFNFNIFDNNNQKIQLSDIDSGSFIKSYIELSDIWVNTKEYGINWKIMQMKVYPEFDFQKCLFTDGPINDYYFINDVSTKIKKNDNQQEENIFIPAPPIQKKTENNVNFNKVFKLPGSDFPLESTNSSDNKPMSFIDELRMKQSHGQIKLKHVPLVEKVFIDNIIFNTVDFENIIDDAIVTENIIDGVIDSESHELEITDETTLIELEMVSSNVEVTTPKKVLKKKKKKMSKKIIE